MFNQCVRTLSLGVLSVVIGLCLTTQTLAQHGWKSLPIRNQAQFLAGQIGGEAEQHWHGMNRSLSTPDVIYLSHDCGQVWRSLDNGLSWKRALCKGMYVLAGMSIQVDPMNPGTVFVVGDSSFSYMADGQEGLYRSTDFGENFVRVLTVPSADARMYHDTIAYDLTSMGPNGAQRWYVGFAGQGMYFSEDYGVTWKKQSSLAAHDLIYAVKAKPGSSTTLYVASSEGFYRSTSQGLIIQKVGNLPSGDVSSIAVRQDQPNTVYAVVKGVGLYKSTNSGDSFTQIRSGSVARVFNNPADWDWLYITMSSSNAQISENDGANWRTVTVIPPLGMSGGWKSSFRGEMAGITPDPRGTDTITAYGNAHLWRSTDSGKNFYDGATLFTGHNWGWWNDSLAFDSADPDRWVQFCADVGMDLTENGADWFTIRQVPYEWYTSGQVSWRGMYAGSIHPDPGSQTIIGSVGMYFDSYLARTTNNGVTWTLVEPRPENYLFVAHNTDNPNIVYAGDKISTNGGASFNTVAYLDARDASIFGMAQSQPDTIYAMRKPRNTIYRSDDAGVTWNTYVTVSWNFNRHDSKPTFCTDPEDPDVIYTIDSSGDLARYNGSSWEFLDVVGLAGPSPYTNFVRHVLVDPSDRNVIYVSLFASGLPQAFRSTDYGETWEDISYNLPRLGSMGLAVSPHTGDVMISGCCGTRVLSPPYASENTLYDRIPDYFAVRGRYIFYNNSSFDGNDAAANDNDFAAVATDKQVLLPGETATLANYTSYSKGVNGIIVDLEDASNEISVDDFEIKVGNDNDPDNWAAGPAPVEFRFQEDTVNGVFDRVTLIWADGAIKKQWVQITILPSERTGLSSPDVFYVGNAIGECGNDPGNAIVDTTDQISARNNPRHFMKPAGITDVNDHDRDGKVNATDEILARNNTTDFSSALKLITAP